MATARITLRLEIDSGGPRVFEHQLESWLDLDIITSPVLEAHLAAAVQGISALTKDPASWKDSEAEEKPAIHALVTSPAAVRFDPIVPCDARSISGQPCNRSKGHHGLHFNEADRLEFEVPAEDPA